MDDKQKRDIIQFTAAAFFLSWISWGILVFCKIPAMSSWYSIALYMIGGGSPGFVALLLPLFRPKGERRSYYKRFFKFKISLKDYLHPVIFASFLVALTYALMFIFYRDAAASLRIEPLYMIFPYFAVMVVGGGIEEFGWRGIIVHCLSKYNFVMVSLGVGVLWAIWHIPLFFVQGTSQYQSSYPVFFILVITTSFALTAIYRRSQSVIPCIIFHALFNSFWSLGFIYGKDHLAAALTDGSMKLALAVLYAILLNRSMKKSLPAPPCFKG